MNIEEKLRRRFWSKVAVGQPDECWEWLAHRDRKGYGKFQQGNSRLAHRIAWEITYGLIPDGMLVCHRCDNSACNNPAHLFLGSNDDNMKDMVSKNRPSRGTERPRSKLTPIAVIGARSLYAKRAMSTAEIAESLHVSQSVAYQAIFGRTWAWLFPDTAYHAGGHRGSGNGRSKLNEQDVIAIRSAVQGGEKQTTVAKKYEVSPSTIGAIVTGQNWSWLEAPHVS